MNKEPLPSPFLFNQFYKRMTNIKCFLGNLEGTLNKYLVNLVLNAANS